MDSDDGLPLKNTVDIAAYVARVSSQTEMNVKMERAGMRVLPYSLGGNPTHRFTGLAGFGLRINEPHGVTHSRSVLQGRYDLAFSDDRFYVEQRAEFLGDVGHGIGLAKRKVWTWPLFLVSPRAKLNTKT